MREKIESLVCESCKSKYWVTEDFKKLVDKGMTKSLCINCIDEPTGGEDDDACEAIEAFQASEPLPEERG